MVSELDIEQADALVGYLRDTGRIDAGESPTVRVLPGGVSCRTVWVRRASGETWVLKQALARLRVKTKWLSDPARIHREALGMRWLGELAPPGSITPLVFEDEEHHVIAMQAVPEPHENWKAVLLAGRVVSGHIQQFACLLGSIHRNAFRRTDELRPIFDDSSHFETLRLEAYYLFTAGQVAEAEGFLRALVTETRAHRLTIVHGDYSPKNVLIHDDRLVLLDHEVIHWGDPAFDLGFSTTHLLSKAHHLPDQRKLFAKAAVDYWQTYCRTLGDVEWREALEPRVVRQTLGCLLARVAGRSPLEYLDRTEKMRQRAAVLAVIRSCPASVSVLVQRFIGQL